MSQSKVRLQSIKIPRFDAGKVSITRLFRQLVQVRKDKLNKKKCEVHGENTETCTYLHMVPILHHKCIHLVNN